MAWSAPRTWVSGETLTAALLNVELRDNLLAAEPVGSLHYYIRAATTIETIINGFALEGNGVQPLRATYAGLNTLLSGLAYPFGSGNGSTTFTLPDVQGRELVSMASGGHADVDALGDSDALAKGSRSPRHNSTNSMGLSGSPGLTGTPGVGSLALPSHVHSGANVYTAGSSTASAAIDGGADIHVDQGNGDGPTTLPAISGAPSIGTLAATVGTLAVSGTVGPGGTRPNDLVPFLVAGVWAVKY